MISPLNPRPRTGLRVAVGPVMAGWGSWDWVGNSFLESFAPDSRPFTAWERTDADLVIVVKHAPPTDWVREARRTAGVVYCPVDRYGRQSEIGSDRAWLSLCSGIWVHCRRLERLFRPHAEVSYIDHPLKYAIPTRSNSTSNGRLVWIGVRSNIPALASWVSRHPLPAPLDVLTNPELPGRLPSPGQLGFPSKADVRVHEWSPERHLEFAATALAALDIKGGDFRDRHKPPAKAYDFVASGIPLALNPGASAGEALAGYGLEIPDPRDHDRWLSEEYAVQTRSVGARLWHELSQNHVGERARVLATGCLQSARRSQSSKSLDDWDQFRSISNAASKEAPARSRTEYERLRHSCTDASLLALIRNDLSVLDALDGDSRGAAAGLRDALNLDSECRAARENLLFLQNHGSRSTRIGIVSILFNWPSTGGGNVHSAELAYFLSQAGYEVAHFIAVYEPWGIGRVDTPTPHPVTPLRFGAGDWNRTSIIERIRLALNDFDADWVVFTDSWNFKPLLARAAGNRPFVLRLQALECLCPLNNVRLLADAEGRPVQCSLNQLATPDACRDCVRDRGRLSGPLHQAERKLAGFGNESYRTDLFQAFARATSVLVVNPLSATMVEPYCRDVRVVTAGMDPARFPWPFPKDRIAPRCSKVRLLFAGLTTEWMKGFAVLVAACRILRRSRTDFKLVATDDGAPEAADDFIEFLGWQSQAELPRQMAASDIIVVPTVAQEALGRTAVEAMAAGKPAVASRIGGLIFTVADGGTGLLCRPGDPEDLAEKLTCLLDDRDLRERLGIAGRKRFEQEYAWPVVIDRHYRPLFDTIVRPSSTER